MNICRRGKNSRWPSSKLLYRSGLAHSQIYWGCMRTVTGCTRPVRGYRKPVTVFMRPVTGYMRPVRGKSLKLLP